MLLLVSLRCGTTGRKITIVLFNCVLRKILCCGAHSYLSQVEGEYKPESHPQWRYGRYRIRTIVMLLLVSLRSGTTGRKITIVLHNCVLWKILCCGAHSYPSQVKGEYQPESHPQWRYGWYRIRTIVMLLLVSLRSGTTGRKITIV